MRIVFMGTPEFAVPTLDALLAAGHEVAAVYTQPPRPGGRRGREVTPSPRQRPAEAAGVEVRTPATLRDPDEQERFRALAPDAAIVAAYGLILPMPVLEVPCLGCLNVHASLLPRWRGAAPIQRAILAGDRKTGVCIMGMEQGLDTGPVYARRETEIGGKTAGELTAELARIGGALIAEVLERIDAITPEPQPEDGATYAHKIAKADARLDFDRPADEVERQVRAFSPEPGAYFECLNLSVSRPVVERVKVLAAEVVPYSGEHGGPHSVIDDQLTIACGTDAIRPTLVKRAGRVAMSPAEMMRGFQISPGTWIE